MAIAFLCVGGLIAGLARLVLGGVGVWTGGTVAAPGAGPAWSQAVSVACGAGLAVVLSLCSYGDSFVAASLPLPGLARVVFLAVGPIIDVKLAGLMTAQLGWRLSWRIAAGGLAGGVVGGCVATLAMPGVI